VAEVIEPEGRKLRLPERALEHLPYPRLVVRLALVIREEPLGLAPALAQGLGLEPGHVLGQRADQLGREVDGPLLVGLRRLHPPEVPGPLHAERPLAPVDVAGLEREGLARAQAPLGKDREERGVARLRPRGGEEGVALLPGHRADFLHALGGGELVGAIRLVAADLERGVGHDDTVVHGVGEHGRERRAHEPHGVLGVALAALLGEEGLDVAAVDSADLEVSEGGEDMALEAFLVVAYRVLVLLVLDQREPARGVGAHADLAVLDGREQQAL